MKRIVATMALFIVGMGLYLAGLGHIGTALGASLIVAGMSCDFLFWRHLALKRERNLRP